MSFDMFFNQVVKGIVIPVFDIAIMTFIIFYIYLFIEKTRAENLAKGLLIVLLAFFVLEIFGFPVVSWLFDKLLVNLLLILFLLFSPEIRTILINLGKKTPYQNLAKGDIEFIKVVVDSVFQMSEKRLGALLVLSRKDDVVRQCSSSIPMDASISEEIFNFIFDKKSIIHDGAVIIRNKRIISVSAILPLSQDEPESGKLDKHMGTRHRAALGISEESDAVSVVVSEETGGVSLFESGQPFRDLNAGELRRLLRLYLYSEEEEDEGEASEA